jgi:hypothetical protein
MAGILPWERGMSQYFKTIACKKYYDNFGGAGENRLTQRARRDGFYDRLLTYKTHLRNVFIYSDNGGEGLQK